MANKNSFGLGKKQTHVQKSSSKILSDIKFSFPSVNSEATISAIPAHKYVLAVSSPVFFTMFYGDLAESGDSVNITDCDPDVFLRFLRFIYCDEASFEDIDCAIKVWRLADMYDVPSLARECVKYLDGNMEPLDAFDVLTYARQFNDEEMEKASWEVIDYNAEVIVADESILDVKQEFLLSFVKRSSARIRKETTLFQALDRWAAKRCEEANMTVNGENKRSFMGEELLKQFRFSLMSPSEFSHVVMPTEILLSSEIIDVFKQFTPVSIPGGFKFSLSPRKTVEDLGCSYNAGRVHVPDQRDSVATSLVHEKSGLFTFVVKTDITLSGVTIVTDKGRESCQVSLSVTKGGKTIRQIKDKVFIPSKETLDSNTYEEINVIFNRPLKLLENTCYTIETKTDTTNNLDSGFVRGRSPQSQTSGSDGSQSQVGMSVRPGNSTANGRQSPQLQTSGSLFGQQSQAKSGSLFGQSQATRSMFGQQSQTNSGTPFGQSPQSQTARSLFGQQSQTTSGSLFGQSPQSQTVGSLFGQQSQTTSGSLFGSPSLSQTTSGSFLKSGGLVLACPKRNQVNPESIISCHCFGRCDKYWPEHSEYCGEIMTLFFKK